MQEKFFERQQYEDILTKRINGLKEGYRQNIAIIGDENVGKTSLIFNFIRKFYDNRIVILYLEVKPEPLVFFARRFISILLYNFLSTSGLPLKEDLEFLLKNSVKFIPKTTEKIKFILGSLDKRKKNNIFSELLSLCQVLYQETNKSCVVIFDEFHNLETVGTKSLYNEWSKILISQKNTLYIITSSLRLKAKNILSKGLSLLFGNFEVVNIEPFDTKASEEYLNYKLEKVNLSRGERNFLVNFTGGLPLYLKIISEAILKSTQPDLAGTLEELLFEASGILNQRFCGYLKRFLESSSAQDYISLLYLVSCGHNKLKDIAHILHKPQKELAVTLGHLLELNTVSRNGEFLIINDRVFNFWVRFVYQEKMQALTFDAQNQKAAFRQNLKGMLQEFLADAAKPVAQRVTELLRLFQDERVQIERKRFRLEHFREIKPLELRQGNLREGLVCRSVDSLWIIAFKAELLTEEDVTAFAKECKKYQRRLSRRILVTSQSIDANARLRALEEKVWMWDLSQINQLLDLFSKPRMIL